VFPKSIQFFKVVHRENLGKVRLGNSLRFNSTPSNTKILLSISFLNKRMTWYLFGANAVKIILRGTVILNTKS